MSHGKQIAANESNLLRCLLIFFNCDYTGVKDSQVEADLESHWSGFDIKEGSQIFSPNLESNTLL